MKVNELRIGNWLHSNLTNIDFTLDIQTLSTMITYGNENGGRVWIAPIPLTEEWLLKFGFENDYDGCPTLNHKASRFQYSINSKELLYQQTPHNDWSGFPCQYVHQLQNLYFALTGEELTIKE